LSHPNWSENSQGRIIYDADSSVNACDFGGRCRQASPEIRTWYRLALRPTSERLVANWPLGVQHAPALGFSTRQRKAFIQSEERFIATVFAPAIERYTAGDRAGAVEIDLVWQCRSPSWVVSSVSAAQSFASRSSRTLDQGAPTYRG
jgi:hypothetical protein